MKIKKAIKELKAILEEHGNMELLVSSDQEGNSYRSAHVGGRELGYPEDWEWQVVNEEDIADGEYGDEDEVAALGLVPVVIIW